jgi:predicted phosphoribosyltransferase
MDGMARFRDRLHAGRELGELVASRGTRHDAVVLALPRGGVPMAVPVADALSAPLDVLVVRKLRTPGRPELAFGAVASGGVRWLSPESSVLPSVTDTVSREEATNVRALESRYRPLAFTSPEVAGRTVVLVDDGIATGSTAQAAVAAARLLGAAEVIVATPIAPPGAVRLLEAVADRVDAVEVWRNFGAVSVVYDDFAQVADDEVAGMLRSKPLGMGDIQQ